MSIVKPRSDWARHLFNPANNRHLAAEGRAYQPVSTGEIGSDWLAVGKQGLLSNVISMMSLNVSQRISHT